MQSSRRRFLALAGGGVAALAGCVGGNDDARSAAESGPSSDDGDGADMVEPPTRDHQVPLSEDLAAYEQNAVSGGVPQDGIPSIDDPEFGGPDEGDAQMDPGDIVFGVEIDGDARAYPQRILVSHEIVNDTVGGQNVAVTYCPLTGTAVGFERGDVEFGVSGMLVNNNLIMYDRGTDSWWPQVLGASVLGSMTGDALQEFPVVWTTWERWRETHPDTQVLTEDTGSVRDYDNDPYGAYNPSSGHYADRSIPFEMMNTDDRHHPKAVFLGARTADGAVAFEKERLREDLVLDATVGGVGYTAVYDRDLDFGWVYRNPDETSIVPRDEGYTGPDDEEHAAGSLPLERVNAFDAMWFAWAGFYPDTVVV